MKIAIVYGSTTGMTQAVAEQIKDEFGDAADAPYDVISFKPEDIAKYDALLFGIPTWHIGEMQEDWEDAASSFAVPEIKGKKVALFGLGDQGGYPDTFGDALGLLWNIIEPAGAELVGRWPTDSYTFDESVGVVDGKFLGLMCDEDQQPELTEERVTQWCAQIKQELGLDAAAV